MTYKYGLTVPVKGSNKLKRFRDWAAEALPDLDYRLPPQTPVKSESMTIRLRSVDDRARVLGALPATLP